MFMFEPNGTWRSRRLLASAGLLSLVAAAVAAACSSNDGGEPAATTSDAGVGTQSSESVVRKDTLQVLRSVHLAHPQLESRVPGALRRHSNRVIPRLGSSGTPYAVEINASARARDALGIWPIGNPNPAVTLEP